jgi:VanZ family protein
LTARNETSFSLVFLIALHLVPFGTGTGNLSEMKVGPFRLDHLLHAAMFLPWMAAPRYFLAADKRTIPGKTAVFWLIAGVVLSAGTELIHYWLPYRAFNMSDMMFNVAGVFLGGVCVWGYVALAGGGDAESSSA